MAQVMHPQIDFFESQGTGTTTHYSSNTCHMKKSYMYCQKTYDYMINIVADLGSISRSHVEFNIALCQLYYN